MTQKTVFEYPTGLSGIPYASYLQIEKYSYDEAQKKVQDSQNDALGSLQNSRIADIVEGGVNAVANIYGSGESRETGKQRKIEQQLAEQDTFKLANARGPNRNKKISLADADDDTEVIFNGKKTTVGALKKEKQRIADLNAKGLMSTMCHLPLPNEFQYKYGADWNNEFKLGTLALAADDALRAGGILALGAGVGALKQGAVNMLTGDKSGKPKNDAASKKMKKIESMITSAAGGAGAAVDPMKVNSELSPKNIAGLAGLAPNENSIQFFQRMQGRDFSFRFELAARNKVESDLIIEVIEWFKRGMHPNSKNGKGSALMLTFPDVFFLTPKFVRCNESGEIEGKPIQHPMMPRSKLCALTGLTINTTPFGQLQTIFDGTIPVVTMELQFKETTKLTRVDMEGSQYKRNQGLGKILNKGRFVADPKSVGTSEVSY
tara:strand:- start:12 stop:1313 length:1302 start_codon:yes stop_codon:yes gene_type:complete